MARLATEQRAAIKAYALARIASLKAQGVNSPCIVIPRFENQGENWVPTRDSYTVGENTEFCSIMVAQNRYNMSPGSSFIKTEYRLAFIPMRVADVAGLELSVGNQLVVEGQTGKIVTLETTTEPDEVFESNIKFANDEARKNGTPCTINGEVIYRKSYFTVDPNVGDELVQHDNSGVATSLTKSLTQAAQESKERAKTILENAKLRQKALISELAELGSN